MSERYGDFSREELDFLNMAVPPADCPLPDRLRAYMEDALPGDQRVAVDSHLAGCPVCRDLVVTLGEFEPAEPDAAALKRLDSLMAPHLEKARRRSRRWGLWTFAAIPATAMIAILAFPVWINRDLPQLPDSPSPLAAPAFAALATIEIQKPPVRLPLSGLLVWRGAPSVPPAPVVRELAEALVPYRQDDFAGAARLLEPVDRRHPSVPEAAFYLGVSLLLAGRPADAVAPLERAARLSGEGTIAADADWYLAVALLRTGSLARARAPLEKLCAASSEHAREACGLLRVTAAPAAGR